MIINYHYYNYFYFNNFLVSPTLIPCAINSIPATPTNIQKVGSLRNGLEGDMVEDIDTCPNKEKH